jgi:amidohydrolase
VPTDTRWRTPRFVRRKSGGGSAIVELRTQQRPRVGEEADGQGELVEFGHRRPTHLGHLAIPRGVRTWVDDLEAVADERHGVVDVGAASQPTQRAGVVDPDLLGELTARARLGILAGGQHAADREVPPARPQVLGGTASMDQDPSVGVAHDDEHCGMAQPLGAHPATAHDLGHAPVVVEHVDEFVARIGGASVRIVVVGHAPSMPRMTDPLTSTLQEEARDLLDGMTDLRRRLHRWPEVGNHLPLTREAVQEAIDGLPLDVTLHETTSGIAAMLTGSKPGPTILLRGDMDALPMPEDTGLDFSSSVDGAMHACGHDTHTSMLVGAARLLAARKDDLAGRVLFMFQPGEEGHHGARYMLEEGLLDVGPHAVDGSASPVTGAFAIHITSSSPTGFMATRPGPVMASSDTMRIVVRGRGGHGSEPFRALDPIPIACEIVQAMQTMVTRRIDVFDPTIVTVTKITAGTTTNVIPDSAEIQGTIRAISQRTRQKVHDAIRRVADGVCAAHEADVDVEIVLGYPVTVNGADFTEFSSEVAADVIGSDRVIRLPNPVMGAEDFSYVIERVPGTMMFLGGTPHDRSLATAAPNHSPRVFFEESAMVDGAAVYAAMAVRHLATP